MLIGIHEDALNGRTGYIKILEKILDYNNIPYVILNSGGHDFWEKIRSTDIFIYRWLFDGTNKQIGKTIMPIIENDLKIKCFPDDVTSWHYDDKIKQYFLLKAFGFPVIESYVFWNKKSASEWVKMADYPLVFKLKGGAGSKNVFLIKNVKAAEKIVEKMFGSGMSYNTVFGKNRILSGLRGAAGKIYRHIKGRETAPFWSKQKNYVLFQKYLPGNEFDVRVTTIGKRAFVFKRLNRQGDFRASGSGKIDYNIEPSDAEKFIKISFDISEFFKFQCMAYDFLLNEKSGLGIAEISYDFVDRAVYDCEGYFDENLKFQEGHFWPQYLLLKDLLNNDDLKQPDISIE